jgi:hypothetical protein
MRGRKTVYTEPNRKPHDRTMSKSSMADTSSPIDGDHQTRSWGEETYLTSRGLDDGTLPTPLVVFVDGSSVVFSLGIDIEDLDRSI